MALFDIGLLPLAFAGHSVLWVGGVNRLHGFALNRHLVDALTMIMGIVLVALPFVWLPLIPAAAQWVGGSYDGSVWIGVARLYEWVCTIIALVAIIEHVYRLSHRERIVPVTVVSKKPIDMEGIGGASLLAAGVPRFLGTLPGNESLRPRLVELHLPLAGLPSSMQGLRIVHLSDLHMSGRIGRGYFDQLVDAVNRCEADVVALTGDIVEKPQCMDWLDESITRLTARKARCFVLGNHDLKVDCNEIRKRLTDAGWHDVTKLPIDIGINESVCRITGNERPWFSGPPEDFSLDSDRRELEIALVHTPDLFAWARDIGFDLVLAGHNHGGQIRFPVVGPIVAPSRHGTRYARGLFQQQSTVLHVSPGSGSLAPLRWGCPPEVTLIVLDQEKP